MMLDTKDSFEESISNLEREFDWIEEISDLPEVEFYPMYQYFSPTGFKQTVAPNKDSVAAEEEFDILDDFCNEIFADFPTNINTDNLNNNSNNMLNTQPLTHNNDTTDSSSYSTSALRGRSKSLAAASSMSSTTVDSNHFQPQQRQQQVQQNRSSYSSGSQDDFYSSSSTVSVSYTEPDNTTSLIHKFLPGPLFQHHPPYPSQHNNNPLKEEPTTATTTATSVTENTSLSSTNGGLPIENITNLLILETKFLKKYWRNDRKNMQCFPFCPEFGDYYISRTKDMQHQQPGATCSAPVKALLKNFTDNPRLLCALGRIALYKASVEQSYNFNFNLSQGAQRLLTFEQFKELKASCVVGNIDVPHNSNTSSCCSYSGKVTFKVSGWKLNMQLSKVRRPTNVPNKIPTYMFEIFILRLVESIGYEIVARTISTRFTIASTRTLLREIVSTQKTNDERSSIVTTENVEKSSRPLVTTYESEPLSKRIKMISSPLLQGTLKKEKEHEEEEADHSLSQRFKKKLMVTEKAKPLEQFMPTEDLAHDTSIPEAQVLGVVSASEVTATSNARTATEVTRNIQRNIEDHDAVLLCEAWFWCLCLGFVGAHYYYLNRPMRGFLYTVTLGFFFIGYAVDIFRLPWLVSETRILRECRRLNVPAYDQVYLAEIYSLLIPFGIFGAHQFAMKNYAKGCLYLATLGLLGIGWLHDIIFLPIEVQRINRDRRRLYALKHGQHLLDEALRINAKYQPCSKA